MKSCPTGGARGGRPRDPSAFPTADRCHLTISRLPTITATRVANKSLIIVNTAAKQLTGASTGSRRAELGVSLCHLVAGSNPKQFRGRPVLSRQARPMFRLLASEHERAEPASSRPGSVPRPHYQASNSEIRGDHECRSQLNRPSIPSIASQWRHKYIRHTF